MAIALDRDSPDDPNAARLQQLKFASQAAVRSAAADVTVPPRPDPAARVPEQFAQTDSAATPDSRPRTSVAARDFDLRLIMESFSQAMADPPAAMEYFFARLFVQSPEIRSLFPLAMAQTRIGFFTALARLIWGLADQSGSERELGRIARDHRKFGVLDKHYKPFFAALTGTAEQLSGSSWTPEVAEAWRGATDYISAVMRAAVAADLRVRPAWWVGEIVEHDQRAATVAVITIRPDQPLRYLPGQYLTVQVPRWPRMWRRYSIANAPRENGLIDLHVRSVAGGMVSGALVSHCGVGDTILLGAARGDMAVPDDPDRDLVFVAGGTGLAPAKALIESVIGAARPGRRRNVTLYFGARRPDELYDLEDLDTLRGAYPSLSVVPVVEYPPDYAGQVGKLPHVISKHPSFRSTDVFVSGPAGLVAEIERALADRVRPPHLHHDPMDLLRAAMRTGKPLWAEARRAQPLRYSPKNP